MRGLSLLAAGLCASLAAAAPGQQLPETFRSSRELLTINASIRDASGRPVTDLQPADFSVRIDGEVRRVLVARVFGRETTAAAAETAPVARARTNVGAPPGRIVVIAVDRDSIRAGAERALLETASRMLDTLTPADAAGAVALPGAVTDLTRDRAAVAEAIRQMTGTQPIVGWRHRFSWQEAIGFERRELLTIQTVEDRECPRSSPDLIRACRQELPVETADMLRIGRSHASVMMANLLTLIDNLRVVSAPKHVVLISAGLPFDMDLLPRYQALARTAAQSHVALSVVQLDQQESDASEGQLVPQIFGGRQDTEGLANIASISRGDREWPLVEAD